MSLGAHMVATASKEPRMRLARIIVGIILVLVGAVWSLQGANVFAGSVMSGHSQWLYVGIVLIVIGVVVLLWPRLRPKP